MKIRQIFAAACAVSFMGTSVNAAPPADINEAIAQMNADAALVSGWAGHQFARAVPFNSTAGNVVPNQLKLFGFSVGVAAVGSTTDADEEGFKNLPTNLIDTNGIDMFDTLPFANILGHFKLGLPWGLDAGVRIGGLPTTDADEGDTHLEIANKVFGLDLRKVLVAEGAAKPFGLTAGINFTSAKGHATATTALDAPVAGSGVTFTNAATTARTEWDSQSVGGQLLMNKKFFIFTPYIGASANKNFGDVDTSIANSGSVTHTGSAQSASLVGTGASVHETINDWDLRGLLGLDITLFPFMRLGIGGEIASEGKMGGSLGLRVTFH